MMHNCFYSEICDIEDCSPSCIRYIEMNNLLTKSRLPSKFFKPVVMDVPKEDAGAYSYLLKIASDMKNVVDNGKNFTLYSSKTGNGKTTWAVRLMQNYFNQIWNGNGLQTKGIFINVPTFTNLVKQSFSSEDESVAKLQKLLPTVPLLVLDDIGATKLSEFDISLLTTIVDSRIMNGKSTIFTTNCDKKQLEAAIGVRLADRVYNTGVTVTFKSETHRNK